MSGRRRSWELGDLDRIPDVRDGLTRVERVILVCLEQAQKEKRGRMVSTAMLYGRVVEHVNIDVPEFQRVLQRLVGVQGGSVASDRHAADDPEDER